MKRLVHEVHRRSLWQVLSIYVVASWVVLQVVDVLVDNFGLPGWFPAFALALLLIGLPVVLATAFVQEGSPAERDEPLPDHALLEGEPHPLEGRDAGARGVGPEGRAGDEDGAGDHGLRSLLTWRNAITGGVLAFALWGVVAAGWIVVGQDPAGDAPVRSARPSVAVLPFDNLSGDDDARPFTDGVHDDLLTELARIGSLKVISRTSVMEYRETQKSLPQIAGELGVSTILEGAVQRSGDRIRVNAQLIDAGSDEHLWAETFDRRLTAQNVFDIQSELARRIAAALQARLTPEEEARIAARPTDDIDAYDFYVRGMDYRARSYDEEDLELAIEMFERAVDEDSAFVEAWASLSEAHSFHYLLGHDRSDERLARAKRAVDRALSLDPDEPRALLALGLYHYRGFQAYERALAVYERAAADLPGDARLQTALAGAHRRVGNWERALEHFARAVELDPRSASAHYELGGTYSLMRRYAEARPHLERATALSPDWTNPYGFLADVVALETGSLAERRRVLEQYSGERQDLSGHRFWQEIYEGSYAAALEAARELDEINDAQFGVYPRSFWTGRALLLMAREEEARAAWDSARAVLEERLEEAPDDPRVHSVLGETYARLGREEAALRHGRRAVELYPVERDAVDAPVYLETLARIHVIVGRTEDALDLLERIMTIPGRTNPVNLLYDPAWDPLREEARFRALVAEHGGSLAPRTDGRS